MADQEQKGGSDEGAVGRKDDADPRTRERYHPYQHARERERRRAALRDSPRSQWADAS
ncbi:MAG TPA: hypothetical protein VHX88_11375 [Solirubrobacteraceae bacterium]|jgi:hypothetical protein|nr:hypothetical protein [Solirubrobacteraceae bacterium]